VARTAGNLNAVSSRPRMPLPHNAGVWPRLRCRARREWRRVAPIARRQPSSRR
jgi:hypothetical protein